MLLTHIIAIGVTVLFVLYADKQGLMWVLGKKEVLTKAKITFLHRLVSLGLVVIVLSGATMAYGGFEYYISNPVFLIKMGFVLVLIINAFFIGTLSRIATERSYKSLSTRERIPLLFSGAMSCIGWLGAILLGLKLSGWW